ncbi:MAG: LptF/LptG family permease [Planctomycetota bacterium]
MSRLDRYVWKIVLGSFVAGLLFFLFITIVMDLISNVSRYIRAYADLVEHLPPGGTCPSLLRYLAEYYLMLLPVLVVSITPFVTVIACMFAVARLQGANEVVPMLFTGRSMRRILRPMLLCGLVAGAGMAGCWQWIVPTVASQLAAFDGTLNEGGEVQHMLLVQPTDEVPNQRFCARTFTPSKQRLEGVSMLIEGEIAEDNVLIRAGGAVWDAAERDWRLVEGVRVTRHGEDPHIEWLGRPDLTPEKLLRVGRQTIDADTQSYTELAETMAQRANRPEVRLAFHRHITFPLGNLVLLLMALPLAVSFERGQRIGRVLAAIALCGGYALFDMICQSLGTRGFHPVVAAWSPTIVFGSLGIVLFGGMRT